MEKLAALIPRPAINLVLYHAALAPQARWRSQVVSDGRPQGDLTAHPVDASPRRAGTPGAWTWATLMRRVFDFAVPAGPRGGGRVRIIATVHDPLAVQAILAHLARSLSPEPPTPAPPTPAALPSPQLPVPLSTSLPAAPQPSAPPLVPAPRRQPHPDGK